MKTRLLLCAALAAMCAASIDAQRHHYRRTTDWGQLPAGKTWGEVTSVDIAPDGTVFVLSRCFAKDNNGCIGRENEPAILKFDKNGKLLKAWGEGMFVFPHGAFLDQEGNYWTTDSRGANGKGHVVYKFSGEGKLLMTLGKPGVAGNGHDTFNMPTDVVVAPNGDIFVADGHGGDTNARVVKFTNDGKYIKEWGKKGKGPDDISEPHTIAIDSQGRLLVGDRENNRIKIFDQDGKLLDTWKQFGRPSGVFIDKKDTIYVVDSQSNATQNPGFTRGIRIGSAKDGKVTAFIPDTLPDPDKNNNAGAEGIGADASGNVYAGEVTTMALKKYVRK